MAVISGRIRGARGGTGALEALGLAGLFVLSLVAASIQPHEHRLSLRWSAVVLAGLGCCALLWRRRHPSGVLAATVGCGLAFEVLGFRESPLVNGPVLVAVYTTATLTDRRRTWTAGSASAAVLLGAAVVCAPPLLAGPRQRGAAGLDGSSSCRGGRSSFTPRLRGGGGRTGGARRTHP
ncbi:DUF7134 domain-containing protein [Streptomyces tendae]|uniref:DUF7134 domain-containing protein n=1 Tax=Streptomyces tendae TaxID=1932 RepID=UPI003F4DA639